MFLNSVGNPTPNHESKYIVPCPGHPRAHFPFFSSAIITSLLVRFSPAVLKGRKRQKVGGVAGD